MCFQGTTPHIQLLSFIKNYLLEEWCGGKTKQTMVFEKQHKSSNKQKAKECTHALSSHLASDATPSNETTTVTTTTLLQQEQNNYLMPCPTFTTDNIVATMTDNCDNVSMEAVNAKAPERISSDDNDNNKTENLQQESQSLTKTQFSFKIETRCKFWEWIHRFKVFVIEFSAILLGVFIKFGYPFILFTFIVVLLKLCKQRTTHDNTFYVQIFAWLLVLWCVLESFDSFCCQTKHW